ncbi:hypothetical protein BC829DRAFT_382046 [Chytridium lagenaria]|nr:hypothetical protein BC829DRAFT_382046 [Chytridium lagenaria]
MNKQYPPDPSIHKILVTGGAGFIASHVVIKLVQLYPEYQIFNLDKLDYCSSLKSLSDVNGKPNYKFIKGDVTSTDFVNFIMKEYQIDTVFHFAAQSHVDNSFGDSFEFTKNNVLGTHVLLEAARLHGVTKFIHVSTDEVYGEIDRAMPCCDEDANLSPSNPYSATKAAAECLAQAYLKSFKLPVIITRSNNIYGPHQYPEKIIPKFICSLLTGRKCYIHGDGSNSRHYVYVTDAADAFITVLHQGVSGQAYNIGTDFEISNLQLARYLLVEFGIIPEKQRESAIEENHVKKLCTPLEGEDKPFNDRRYAIGSAKMKALGWYPTNNVCRKVSRGQYNGTRNSSTWWEDDIQSALVAHPTKKMPVYSTWEKMSQIERP